MTAVGIAVAGALGALARYGLDERALSRVPNGFPWATLAVNLSGSLALGFVFTLLTESIEVDPWLRSTLMIGFLGAYTTFSTLSLDSYRLFAAGASGLALANLAASVCGGLAAVWLGITLARAVG